MLVADDAERDYAVLEKTKDLPKKWSDLGFNVISMKNDFKTGLKDGLPICLGYLSVAFAFGIFAVNSGLITIEEEGTYLATYTVRVPEGQTVASNITLNVNDASQSSAITEVGGDGPVSFTAQAICDVCERSTIALRSSEAINITDPSVQPLVTLSLVKI